MRASMVVLSIVFLAQVSPAGTKGKIRAIPGWGDVIDPAGDCRFFDKDNMLKITVPGTPHNLNPLPGWNNMDAPRVVREIDGDFSIQVRVAKFVQPKANTASNKDKPASFVGSGLLVWQDDKNFVRFLRAANADRKDFPVFVAAEYFAEGKMAAGGAAKTADQDTLLRIERKKGRITLSESADGKSWSTRRPPGRDIALTGKVKVGIAVINSTTAEITHEFSALTLFGH